MRVNVTKSYEMKIADVETCLIIPLFEKDFPLESAVLAEEDELALQALADKEIINGTAGECYYYPRPTGQFKGILVLGLGDRKKFLPETLRRAAGTAAAQLATNKITQIFLDISHYSELPAEAFIEGIILSQYDFSIYKQNDDKHPAPVKVEETTLIIRDDYDPEPMRNLIRISVLSCLSANGARHLANTPPNEMTPVALAAFAEGIAEDSGCECTILEPGQMAALGMNAILGVARGSAQPPRLIILKYHHSDDAKTVAIVGKGVTFDTGGISIKPAASMHEMKYDMCGAAAVLCAMMNVVELKPKVNVICVVPAAENMTGDAAQRPGDIIKAYNGKTIEVHNTDAEGRLILADALAYTIDKYKPDMIVDLATLTGACVIGLGHYAAGLFSTDDILAESLRQRGDEVGERVWRLPLWEEYERLIDGTHADLCNIGPREGGAITAAAFLKQFTGDTPWAHIDIAGTAWGAKNIAYLSTDHASGYGVRLLTHWIMSLN